jgi:Protein of unknown function (DUF4058)
MLVLALNWRLPLRFIASPQVHLGAFAEIDVSAYDNEENQNESHLGNNGNGGVATVTAVWAPPRPTLTKRTDLPAQDEYEVRVYDEKHNQRLVAAIELVSPANKDRPESRRAFVAKCAALLQEHVSVTIVDLVTIRESNLYAELLDLIGVNDPALGNSPPPIYAVACRATKPDAKPSTNWQLETWFHEMKVGQPLPTLPLWVTDDFAVPIELEATYEETCKGLRIP